MSGLLKFLYLVLIASFPFSFEMAFDDQLKIELITESLFLPISFLSILLLFKSKEIGAKQKKILVLLGFLLLSYVISTVFALNKMVALKSTIKFTLSTCAFLLPPIALTFKKQDWSKIFNVYLFSYSLLLVYSAFNYLTLGIDYHNSYEMSKPFSAGHSLLFISGLPAIAYAVDRVISKKLKSIYILPVAIFIFLSFISYSRFFWVFIPFAIFILLLWHFRKQWYLVLLAFILIASSGLFLYQTVEQKRFEEKAWESDQDYKSLFRQVKGIFSPGDNESNRERLNKWKACAYFIENNPLTGIGINNFIDQYPLYVKEHPVDVTSITSEKMNTHNLYLGHLTESGSFGIVALLALLFHISMISFIHFKQSGNILFFVTILGFLLFGLVEDYFLLGDVMPAFWIISGYTLFLYDLKK